MDAYGHVNNTAYLSYLEQARVSMFFDRYDSSFERGTVVSRHQISYLKPVIYHPEPLRLELWIEEVRAASFRVCYDVFDGEQLVARASTDLVTYDFATERPRRLSAEERRLLHSFTDGPGTDSPGSGDIEGTRNGDERAVTSLPNGKG